MESLTTTNNQKPNTLDFRGFLHSIKVDEFGESRIVLIADSSQLAQARQLIDKTQKLLQIKIDEQ
jgi:hypothetical protein